MTKTWYIQVIFRTHSDGKVFVMNISGADVCFYWAEFPAPYLETIRTQRLTDLAKFPMIRLHHTKQRNLKDVEERNTLIREFLAIVCCLADGNGKMGHLRRDPLSPIHQRNS